MVGCGDTQILLAVKIALFLLYSLSGGEDAKTLGASSHARVLALSLTTTASTHYEPPGETFTT